MNANNDLTSPDCVRKSGVFCNRRLRVLEDISNRGICDEGSPLPKISEESEESGDEKENNSQHELHSTPRRRVVYKCKNREANDLAPTSSTPLSRRQPTPKTPKRVPHNPFEAELISKLHRPICSPSVFSVIVSPTRSLDENFEWTIEDVSRIKPVHIEEYPENQYHFVDDPDVESRVQQTIDAFFKEKLIASSPLSNEESPHSFLPPKQSQKETKDASSQTALSLPVVLPPELEAMLKPYFNQDQNDEESECETPENQVDEEMLSQSGLRRKLLFHVTEEVNFSPDSPLVNVCWEQGLSRTNLQGSRSQLRSPTLSPIGGCDRHTPPSPKHNPDGSMMYTSRMSMDVSYHSPVQTRRSTVFEEATSLQTGWAVRRRVLVEEDQTMDSFSGTPVLGNSPQPNSTDHGYHTDLSHHLRSKYNPDSWASHFEYSAQNND